MYRHIIMGQSSLLFLLTPETVSHLKLGFEQLFRFPASALVEGVEIVMLPEYLPDTSVLTPFVLF